MTNFTSYEIAIMKDDKILEVLCFSERKTKSVLLSVAKENGAKVSSYCTDADLDQPWTYKDGKLSFGAISVAFNGYTGKFPSNAE